jgi:hypothetical protein
MDNNKKLSKRELDYIVNQLQQTQEETASTIALQPLRSNKLSKRTASVKSWILGIVILFIVCLIGVFVGKDYFQKEETLKSAAVVESIHKLSTLATAQAQIKTILSKEDNKLFGKSISFDFPGSKRTLFLVVPGVVTAGVDLKNLTEKNVDMDSKTKTIMITLPHATIIQDPSLDLKGIQTFSSEGVFRSDANWDEGFQMADLAKQRIKKEAVDSGLLKIAEDNARLALQNFFGNLDYDVEVNFK